ncbi:MAG: Smr/MutS family protein [Saprospiraceae bacterium]|nr:Smr/MutS family protein [Saprospiraceae bacterium]MDW8228693.1 Smr/MutS family protein [Saprospiraceae bacterium]
MLLAPGTKVRLRYTGERAVVVSRIDDDTLMVRLEDDPEVEIPAFEEDLLPTSAPATGAHTRLSGVGGAPQAPEAPLQRKIKSAQPISSPEGISLVFEPMPGRDGAVSRYAVWLLNDTDQECLFEVMLDTATRVVLEAEGKLEAATALEVGTMLADDLSDRPEARLTCRRISTEGIEAPVERQVRLRPKTFFNARQAVPILGVEAYRFVLLEQLTPTPAERSETDLREHARKHTRKPAMMPQPNVRPIDPYDVAEVAQFSNEIDLHAEKLLPNYEKLDKGQILHLQLAHFRTFIDRAMRLGIPRVFVIHGVGEGKLRAAIAEELRRHPGVWKFKNEYHRKYGYGATEVIFY